MTIDNTASSVICFKNGYSYVNIPVKLDDESKEEIKQCLIGPLPSFAVHGTVSLEADHPDQVNILSLAQAQEEEKEQDLKIPTGKDFSHAAFMEANIGSSVKLTLVRDDSSSSAIEGLVKSVHQGEESKVAILRTQEKSSVLLDCSKIVQIETSKVRVEGEDGVKSLVVRFKEKKEGKGPNEATLSFLTRGLTWAPSYSLLLNQGEKTMKMEGKACLLCDLPFFKGNVVRDISLVAGQPKIEFGNVSDPLASGEGAQRFIDQLSRGAPPRVNSQMTKAPRAGGARGHQSEYEECGSMQMEEGIKGGEVVEDFYHYQLENVPLKYHQPLSINFIKEIHADYEDIYYFDLNKKALKTSRSTAKNDTDEDLLEAIHGISFKNRTGQLLTTAPVSVLMQKADEEGEESLNEKNFMVQGLMKFTPAGKSATVEITKAMDVDGKFLVETCKERKIEVITEGSGGIGAFFSLGPKKKYAESIQKNAKVMVNNMKSEEVKCKIEYVLFGHLEGSQPEPNEKTERQLSNSHALNPTTKYVWEVKVPANKTAEINFTFCIKQWSD